MKIGLMDADGHHFPNLPLMKLSAYHKAQGDAVEWWDGFSHYDILYISKVFTEEYSPAVLEPVNADRIIKGGTGYGLENKLPEAVEHIYPDYSLYPKLTKETAYGFLTRGCPRACAFCIVAEKEGRYSHKVADLSEFWSGQKNIKLLDPNLLACPQCLNLLQQLADSKAWVDFTQGLDIRLITPENVCLLNQVKIKKLHFAWDNPEQDLRPYFEKFNELSSCKDYRRKGVYVLTNFGSTHEQDLYRVYALRNLGYDPYVMIYNKRSAPKITRDLQRWCNNKRIFRVEPRFEKYNPKGA